MRGGPVRLWVSMIPIAGMADLRLVSAYDGCGPAGQQCVESKPRSYEATAGPLAPGTRALVKKRAIPRGHSGSEPTRPRSRAPSHVMGGPGHFLASQHHNILWLSADVLPHVVDRSATTGPGRDVWHLSASQVTLVPRLRHSEFQLRGHLTRQPVSHLTRQRDWSPDSASSRRRVPPVGSLERQTQGRPRCR